MEIINGKIYGKLSKPQLSAQFYKNYPGSGSQSASQSNQASRRVTPKKGTVGSQKLSLPTRLQNPIDQNDPLRRFPSPRTSPRLEHAIEYERLNGMPLITYDPLETFETEEVNSSLGSVGSDDFPKNEILDWGTNFKPLSSLKAINSPKTTTVTLQYNLKTDYKKIPASGPQIRGGSSTTTKPTKAETAIVAINLDRVQEKTQEKNPKLMLKKFVTNAKVLKGSSLLEAPTSKTDRIDLCNLYKKLNQHESDNHVSELFENNETRPNVKPNHSFSSTHTNITVIQPTSSEVRQIGSQSLRPLSPDYRSRQLSERNNFSTKTGNVKSKITKKQAAMFNEPSQSSHFDLSNVSTDIRGKSQDFIFSDNVSSLNYPHAVKKLPNQKNDNSELIQKRSKEPAISEVKKDKDRKVTPGRSNLQFSNKKLLTISIPEQDQAISLATPTKTFSKTDRHLPSPLMMKTMPSGMKINLGSILRAEDGKSKHSSPATATARKNSKTHDNPDYLNISVMKSLGFKPLNEKDIINVIVPSKHSDFSYNPKYFKPISDDRISQLVSCLATSR